MKKTSLGRLRIYGLNLFCFILSLTLTGGLLGCFSIPKEASQREIALRLSRDAYGSFRIGQFQEARDLYLQALQIAEGIDDLELQANTLANIGSVYLTLKRPDLAEPILTQALEIAHKIGQVQVETNVKGLLGDAALLTQDPDSARSYYTEALTVAQNAGLKETAGDQQVRLASLEASHGDPEAAVSYADDALRSYPNGPSHPGRASALRARAKALVALGRFEEAHADATDALTVDKELENSLGIAADLSLLADISEKRGDEAAATDYRERAEKVFQYLGLTPSDEG